MHPELDQSRCARERQQQKNPRNNKNNNNINNNQRNKQPVHLKPGESFHVRGASSIAAQGKIELGEKQSLYSNFFELKEKKKDI